MEIQRRGREIYQKGPFHNKTTRYYNLQCNAIAYEEYKLQDTLLNRFQVAGLP